MAVELRTTEASDAWRSLLRAFSGVNRVLAEEMDAETGLGLETYEILLMLATSEDASMRPSELAERRHLSRSGATRLIDRLERDGLVERLNCDSDRRGSLVAITESGQRLFRRAGRVHLLGIDRHVGERLSSRELHDLSAILDKLAI